MLEYLIYHFEHISPTISKRSEVLYLYLVTLQEQGIKEVRTSKITDSITIGRNHIFTQLNLLVSENLLTYERPKNGIITFECVRFSQFKTEKLSHLLSHPLSQTVQKLSQTVQKSSENLPKNQNFDELHYISNININSLTNSESVSESVIFIKDVFETVKKFKEEVSKINSYRERNFTAKEKFTFVEFYTALDFNSGLPRFKTFKNFNIPQKLLFWANNPNTIQTIKETEQNIIRNKNEKKD
jgi:hypothetical protein